MKKVCICGHFAFGTHMNDGQTVKTRIIAEVLEGKPGTEDIGKIDTHGSKLQTLNAVIQAVLAMFRYENLIILPAHNGVRVFGPVLAFFKKFSRCRLHYAVIGGWLPRLLEDRGRLAKALKQFDVIYVETSTMQNRLQEMGFSNIVRMPNCKKLQILQENELQIHEKGPYPFCTFSRVLEQKGIEVAINAVKTVNERKGEIVCSLDIYGPVDAAYRERFECLQAEFPSFVRYCGNVPPDESVQTVRQYAALLFPTQFYTEGVPGTIIDACAAGVPVISSRWESFADVVEDGVTGIGYPFDQPEMLADILQKVTEAPGILWHMKPACLKKAEEFSVCVVEQILIPRL